MHHKLLGNVIFYLVVGLPAYLLIIYGLRGYGIFPYSYINTNYGYQPAQFDLVNFSPNPIFAPYFLIAGFGILGGIIFRSVIKYRRK